MEFLIQIHAKIAASFEGFVLPTICKTGFTFCVSPFLKGQEASHLIWFLIILVNVAE